MTRGWMEDFRPAFPSVFVALKEQEPDVHCMLKPARYNFYSTEQVGNARSSTVGSVGSLAAGKKTWGSLKRDGFCYLGDAVLGSSPSHTAWARR